MELYVNYEYDAKAMQAFPFQELAEFVLEKEEAPQNSRVSVTFVNNDEIQRLNKEFRGIDKPTDVLSFEGEGDEDDWSTQVLPIGVPDDMTKNMAKHDTFSMSDNRVIDNGNSDEIPFELGDVVIAPDVARAQCGDYNMTLEGEISLLLTHGLLHLCGYDHIEDEDADEMQAREIELLREWAKTHPNVAPPDYAINAEMITGEH